MTLYVALISFIGVLVSAFVAYLTSIIVQRNGFRNDYYKTILDKRIEAYQFVDTQLMQLRMTLFDDDDQKQFHLIFGDNGKTFFEFHKNMNLTSVRSIWFSEEMLKSFSKLNTLFYEISVIISDDPNVSERIGKQYFEEIMTAQRDVSRIMVADIGNLHDIKGFLKSKKKAFRY